MNTNHLKKFAQAARRQLREQVASRLERVLKTDSAELREKEKAAKELNKQIAQTSRETVIDRVAYIWFNRFCALRFMDVNRYTQIGTVSPAEGFTQPEILAEAKQGYIDEGLDRFLDRQKAFDLLGGRIPSRDPQQEAYRLLLVAMCNYYNAAMPFLFEKIADYTELLMPDDLLSESSILTVVREALTTNACEDVEVIGWLYQFYISEKKDEVFEELKKNKKITPENIPAATQLFTPHWIVRYLVENSLGRLWMLNKPNSQLVEIMDYYIQPEQPKSPLPPFSKGGLRGDFLSISTPEEIKICDPACGSGHMLVYAFDLLYAIYEEEGYEATEIPRLILENNLYGVEIDERAGELAAFALVMKAREKYRRFFRKPVQPNICVLENIKFTDSELNTYMDEIGRDLFTANLETTLHQFEEADNFGSLIRPALTDMADVPRILEEKDVAGNLFLQNTHERVLQVLRQADYLNPKYHVVIANPPYMGGKGMNPRLKAFLQDNYMDVKSDLFSAFIGRIMDMVTENGFMGVMTPFTWMFLSSYEKLRTRMLNEHTILSLVKPSYTAFFQSAIVPICAFIIHDHHDESFKGSFFDLGYLGNAEEQPKRFLEALSSPSSDRFFRASAANFKKIPGSPIAYHAPPTVFELFASLESNSAVCEKRLGLCTGDNDRFLRYWHEVSHSLIGFGKSSYSEFAELETNRYAPHNKGGAFRRWAGNKDFIIKFDKESYEALSGLCNRLASKSHYFRESLTWTEISSSTFSMRALPAGYTFNIKGPSIFCKKPEKHELLAYFNSSTFGYLLGFVNQTLSFNGGDVERIPFKDLPTERKHKVTEIADDCVRISNNDLNAYEASWDFTDLPLLRDEFRRDTLADTYATLHEHWRAMTLEMQHLEEENNRIFIDAYGLQDEMTPDVPLEEITLTCNPHYRYRGNKTEEELEALLLADTMKEFISYAVGCMFGRYSLDKPGLILANQGETAEDYRRQIPETTFELDEDNVIPLLDGDWFTNNIAERFRKFLRVTFGEKHYEENLAFIENALGKDIRKYFLRDFYNAHLKRYKKRPIYWMFSSPKGSFNALIYMHRYRPDTVSVVLNDYLREFRTKLTARREHLEQLSISASASQREKTRALKDIEKLNKTIAELEEYENEVLYPLATQQVAIDLDDGVKVNYNKFDKALKKVTGLSS